MTTENCQAFTVADIEKGLNQSLEASFAKGSLRSDFLEDYFFPAEESESLDLVTWAFQKESERKNHVPLTGTVKDWGARRDGFDCTGQRDTDLCPPLTNRGVTKYLNRNSNRAQQRTNSEVTSNTGYIVLPTPEGKWGGFDGGAEVGFEVQWNKEQFDSLLAVLTESRKQAEADTEGNPIYVDVGGLPFVIKPAGAKAGLYYKFVLEGRGVKVYIHHNPPKDRQGVRVRYHFESLIRFDLYSLHADFREWLESLGLAIVKETVSRVDMQVMT
ncbi:MAG: hypothetical protein LBP87_11315, partial [Planctomycetaceae bacterium]|nr:hypothetical protein [Planctomycetaceae bacterium]